MGLWDETCALTSLPILPGDPCVLVVGQLPAPPPGEGYLGPHDLGWVERITPGTYDGYGWLRGVEGEHDEERDSLFVHQAAWEGVDAAVPDGAVAPGPGPAGVDAALARRLRKVLHVARDARRDVRAAQLARGSQTFGEELAALELVHTLEVQLLPRVRTGVQRRG